MVEPVTGTMVGTAATKMFLNVIDDLYNFLKSKAGYTISKRKVANKLPTLFSRMQNVRFVKTLWQFETPVDVESFYCASHVNTPRTKGKTIRRLRIDKLADFGKVRNIVVRGMCKRLFC
ncbi:hypothetical protein ACFLWC_05295 [Chloroflexota bacterium]